ncbi:MAG: hypothetical protein JSV71_05990 [Nitrospiraceae bacterium]|nr:MAG: hypothetical protein JSV71_05990 [Nitrospiraceae bacterium]
MKRRYSIIATTIFFFVVAVYLLFPTDENRIRKTIRKSEQAFTSEDVERIMELVSYNYSDAFGNNYLRLKKALQTVFKRLDDIDIKKTIRGITIEGKRAETELDVRVIASPSSRAGRSEYDRGYILGDAGEAVRIKVFFEKPSYTWLITGVEGIDEKQRIF